MSDVKHTPGPWTFVEYMHSAKDLEEIRKLGMTPIRNLSNDGEATIMAGEGEDRKPVARAIRQVPAKRGEGYKTECAERDANARLIAAAPDLLDALKRLLGEMDFAKTYLPDHCGTLKLQINHADDLARAAIAKAAHPTTGNDRGAI